MSVAGKKRKIFEGSCVLCVNMLQLHGKIESDLNRKSVSVGENDLKTVWMTFFMAMLPVVELRGAIPFGVAAGLHPLAAMGAAILGNLFPVPFILLLLRHIFRWLRHFPRLGALISRLERRAHLKGRTVRKYRILGLVLLVAIPLPGTGAWTGALVADVLDIRMRTALPAIAVGVVIAGLAVMAMTCGVAGMLR